MNYLQGFYWTDPSSVNGQAILDGATIRHAFYIANCPDMFLSDAEAVIRLNAANITRPEEQLLVAAAGFSDGAFWFVSSTRCIARVYFDPGKTPRIEWMPR